MSNDTRYNGWPTYETWRVNLEMFDGLSVADLTGTDHLADFLSLYTGVSVAEMALAEMLREQAEEMSWSLIVKVGFLSAFSVDFVPLDKFSS